MSFIRKSSIYCCRIFLGLAMTAALCACTAAIPEVTALNLSNGPEKEKSTHTYFLGAIGSQFNVFELNTSTAQSQQVASWVVDHAIKDFKFAVDGTRLYVDDGARTLYTYEIQPEGNTLSLQLIGSATGSGADVTKALCLSDDGSAVQLMQENTILSFSVSNTGSPTFISAVAGPTYYVGCSASQNFAFAMGYTSDSIKTYSINPITKELAPIQTISVKNGSTRTGPSSMYMSDDGLYIFISEQTASTVSAFRVDPVTGALLKVASTGVCLAPNFISGHSNGLQLYVNCNTNGQVRLTFDRASETLSQYFGLDFTYNDSFYIAKKGDWFFSQTTGPTIAIRSIQADGTVGIASQTVTIGSFVRSFQLEF